MIDEDGICGGSGCPLGTFRDLCGICNGTNDCSSDVKLLNEERETLSIILFWGLIIGAIVFSGAMIYWIGTCCASCLVMERRFDQNDYIIWQRVKWQRENNVKSDPQEVIVAENYESNQRYDGHVFSEYKDKPAYTDIENYTNVKY